VRVDAAVSHASAAPRDSETPQASKPPTQGGPTSVHAQGAANAPHGPAQAEPPEPPHLHEPLKYSIKGFRVAIREESAFRQELTLAAIMVPIGVFVPVEPVERVLLLGSVMLVLIVELLNSSIENAVDRIGLERNELSGRAKDLGSAAVTVALLTCVMTWGLILVPRFGPTLLHWIGAR
jgi:diacylglycerol kinase (ATP)